MSYHYLHLVNALWRGSPAQAERLSRASVAGRWFWGGASNPRDPESQLTADGSDFRLNGRKTFASNASLADRITLRAEIDGGFQVLTIAATGRASPMAMTGTPSASVSPKAAPSASTMLWVSRDEVLGIGAPLSPRVSLVVPLHQLLIVNFYVGTAEGALGEANAYIRSTARPWQASGVSEARQDPYILEHFGELDVAVRAAVALADVAGAELEAAIARGDDLTPPSATRRPPPSMRPR